MKFSSRWIRSLLNGGNSVRVRVRRTVEKKSTKTFSWLTPFALDCVHDGDFIIWDRDLTKLQIIILTNTSNLFVSLFCPFKESLVISVWRIISADDATNAWSASTMISAPSATRAMQHRHDTRPITLYSASLRAPCSRSPMARARRPRRDNFKVSHALTAGRKASVIRLC